MAVKNICEVSNMFGYAELLPSTYTTTMYHKFKKEITDEKFVSVIIKEKKDLWEALKIMLRKELAHEKNRHSYIFRMCLKGGIRNWNIVLGILKTGMKK